MPSKQKSNVSVPIPIRSAPLIQPVRTSHCRVASPVQLRPRSFSKIFRNSVNSPPPPQNLYSLNLATTAIRIWPGTLKSAELKLVLLPPKSPNCNAYLERFLRSLKEECLERMIFFGESALQNAVTEYLVHFHTERHHQGLDHRIPQPGAEAGQTVGTITCRERLGGLLKYYHRQAA